MGNDALLAHAAGVYRELQDVLVADSLGVSEGVDRRRINRARLAIKETAGPMVVAPCPYNRARLRDAVRAGEVLAGGEG